MAGKRLAIVGGGYVGVELSKALENDMDVTLIEPKDAFVHAPAMIRALVDPSVSDSAIIPYEKLLAKGKIVKELAVAVDETGVELASGDRVDADYLVVCTGSSNGATFKPTGADLDEFRAKQAQTHAKIVEANSIAIVGAGAVGTELAGEIAHAFPGKAVTLISSDTALFPTMPEKLGRSLVSKLKTMGVEVVLGAMAEELKSKTSTYEGTVKLSTGATVSSDLVIPAIGSKPETSLLETLPGAAKVAAGRMRVDDYLRPSSVSNIFAAGDLVDPGDGMTIVAISRQQPWLAKTLKALAGGSALDRLKPYSPWKKAPILLPLGPKIGSSFLIVGTFGDWVTSKIKGQDMFISRYRKILGQG